MQAALGIVAIGFACASCGRVEDPTTPTGLTDAEHPSADAGLDDGVHLDAAAAETDGAFLCPAKPSELPFPCPIGAECRFEDCRSAFGTISYYRCPSPDEGPAGWRSYDSVWCYEELGPDGCPRGGALAGNPCTTAGKTCAYGDCMDGAVKVLHFTCTGADAGLIWHRSSTECKSSEP